MKKCLIILCLGMLSVSTSLISGNVTAYLTQATFNVPNQGPYIETYLSVIGHSLKFVKNENGRFQGAVDITVSFLQNGEIKNAQKYTLNSPEIADTTKDLPNFIDQQRYPLANGTYELQMSIADKNKPADKPFQYKAPVTINFPEDRVMISNIQLLESFVKSSAPTILTKSGYDLTPYVSTFYPENINKIKLYAEIYNAKKILGEGEKMVISYYIESYETKTKLSGYSAFSKQVTSEANILLTELNIETLPSGNYNLVIEVRDKENKIEADQRCFIQRKNKIAAASFNFDDLKSIDVSSTFASKYKNIDTLFDYIRCLRPVSSPSELQYAENQLKGKNLMQMQQYFYNFWASRNPSSAELSWLDYYREVMRVNRQYGTYGLKGYDTDRGRVYLQYGAPDYQSKSDVEPSAYPYEIWQYNTLNNKSQVLSNPYNKQSNKKFVFCNTDLVSNNYKLIHSDAKGEIYNDRWELYVHKRDTQSNNLDDQKVPDHFGGQVDDNFNNPR